MSQTKSSIEITKKSDAEIAPKLIELVAAQSIKKKHFEDFKNAVRTVGWLVVLSFIIGIGLTALSGFLLDAGSYKNISADIYKSIELLQLIVKDIGLGLIVAGVAVFGFEWLSHLNKTLERSDLLVAAIAEIDSLKQHLNAVEDLRHDLQKVKDDADKFSRYLFKNSNASYQFVLEGLFSKTRSEEKFKTQIAEIIKHAVELKKGDSKFSSTYFDFLAWHFERVVRHTRMLSNVSNSVKNKDTGGRFIYAPPDGKEVVSSLLGCHIRSLKENDEYVTVSNPKFWLDDKLWFFMKETEEALKNKVKVFRLFNLSSYASCQDVDPRFKSALQAHLDLLKQHNDFYEIRYMLKENFQKAKDKLQGNISNESLRKLDKFYFGLFRQEENGSIHMITLEAIGDEMSEMILTYDGDNSENYKIFQTMWDSSSQELE
ncbi:MAG TPA: hypothetical protein VFA21_13660 [Pyrinomonadaceae bacterium]|nr:hypothetical protein [Pyrinomonadaceae bacterium]